MTTATDKMKPLFRFCPKCQRINSLQAEKCRECGSELELVYVAEEAIPRKEEITNGHTLR